MSEILGKVSSNYKFLGCNNNVKSCENLKKVHSPMMVRMTVRSSAGGETFGRRLVVSGGQQRSVNSLIATATASDAKVFVFLFYKLLSFCWLFIYGF